MNNINTVVINEDRENARKIEEYCKKKKKLEMINKFGDKMVKYGNPILIGSVLSPFDFEGPIIEIVSGVVVLTGFVAKQVSSNKLQKLEAINTNGNTYEVHKMSMEDENNIKDSIKNIISGINGVKSK